MEKRGLEYRWRNVGIMFGTAIIAAFASSTLLLTVYAQQEAQKYQADGSVLVAAKKLGTDPTSGSTDSKVTLRLTFDTGEVFTVMQTEGSPISVKRNDSTVGIVPHVDAGAGNQVTADVFKGFPMGSGEISIQNRIPDIHALEIRRKSSELPIGDLRVKVEVVSITYDVGSLSDRNETSRFRILFAGQCCLECGGITVCGCAVVGPCGSCCSGSCC